MANRFRNPQLRKIYDLCTTLAADRDSEFYRSPTGVRRKDNGPRLGASHRCYFWRGFDDVDRRFVPQAETMAYAAYRAGEDYRKKGGTK